MTKIRFCALLFISFYILTGTTALAVSLDFRSTSSVADDLKKKIQVEGEAINQNFEWWCEPIVFFTDPQKRNNLTGSTKLFLIGYSTDDRGYVEVDPDEDSYMAHRDASFIIEKIAEWSKKYHINWHISVAGAKIGQIKNGKIDGQVREFLEAMSQRSKDDPSVRQTVENKILEKYKDR